MMKLTHLRMAGFRGFRIPVEISFQEGFTIIDGRNGVGKSTVCDAIEFGLTGAISKYKDAKADRESVSNYIWWRGELPAPDNYVEVTFLGPNEKTFIVRRDRHSSEAAGLDDVFDLIVDRENAPKNALHQLCETLVIRDELIAHLSLDQTETARFQFMRDALGSVDSEDTTKRAQSLLKTSKKKSEAAEEAVTLSRQRLASALSRIDEARATLADDQTVSAAANALRTLFDSSAPLDELVSSVRPAVATLRLKTSNLELLLEQRASYTKNKQRIDALEKDKKLLEKKLKKQETVVLQRKKSLTELLDEISGEHVQGAARTLNEIVSLGEEVGLIDDRCPLCNAKHTTESFNNGLAVAKARAESLAARIADLTTQRRQIERSITEAREEVSGADTALSQCIDELDSLREKNSTYESLSAEAGLALDLDSTAARKIVDEQRRLTISAEEHIATLETLSFSSILTTSTTEQVNAGKEVARAEKRMGRARRVENRAKTILNAVRRASAETLDRRLERIGPLLGELYRRLKPHPVWEDIDYKVRGDVQRFLKLEVGDELNPQFLFSSGQRRATGIAFLLSVFLSTSWRRLNAVVLDDPVQHIDDFRAVHLAELMAQLSAQGLQIICAVEDSALADLLCRRIAASEDSPGSRLTLGLDASGDLGVVNEKKISALPASVLSSLPDIASIG